MTLTIRKLSYSLGAEVNGVDITKPFTDESFRDIYCAFLQHCLLLFRGQLLTREQFITFSRRFGELDNTQGSRLPDYHQIAGVINWPKTDGSPADVNFAGAD
jgi:taurine dioxygenase